MKEECLLKWKTSRYNPEIEIFNNTSLTLTLKLNSETYTFSPQQKRTITLNPGTYNYRASAPGLFQTLELNIWKVIWAILGDFI